MKNKKRNTKLFAAVLAIALLLTVGVGGTLAYLIADGGSITNIFKPEQATIQIIEDSFNGNKKTNVCVENTCDIPVYVRVAIVPTWEDENGNPVGVSASLDDLTIEWGSAKWVKFGDYWYYKEAVAVDATTDNLIKEATVTTANGYKMNLQIIAEAIQADGFDAKGNKPVELAWGVDIADGDVKAATIVE